MRNAIVLGVPSFLALHLLTGCVASVPAAETGAATDDPGASAADAGASDTALGSEDASASPISAGLRADVAQVPTGVLCVVFTINGFSDAVIPITVAATASTSSLSLGSITPGPLTVTAAAYGTACSAQGGTPTSAATYESDPVQAVAIAGVVTSIPIELRPLAPVATGVNFEVPAISIAAGANATYAVLADGTLRAWGDNSTQELGYTGASTNAPMTVPGITGAVQVTAGAGFACVLFSNQTVKCFGANNQGQLGIGTTGTPQAPVVVQALYATRLSSNTAMTCALSPSGSEGCWGYWLTQTSINNSTLSFPQTETLPDWVDSSGMMDVAAAGTTICHVTTGGIANCDNSTTLSESLFGQMPIASSRIFAGANQACALRGDGQVWCWGLNSSGQLGVPVSTATGATNILTPQLVPGLAGVTTMALSRSSTTTAGHACATVYGGQAVLCAGVNSSGQLGTGTGMISSSFTQVLGLTNVVELTAGNLHTCARTYNGGVYCWGDNTSGELGDGTNDDRFAPVPVASW